MDRLEMKNVVDNYIDLTRLSLELPFKNAIEYGYSMGFQAGQKTPDNRNINEIYHRVREVIFDWCNEHDTYEKDLLRKIDYCFEED